MSVQKILEYQKIDLNIYKKEKAFAQSAEMKHMVTCKEEIKNKKKTLEDLVAELDKSYALLGALESKIAEFDPEKADLVTDFADYNDIKEFDRYEKDLAKYEENVSNFGKEVTKIIKRIAEIGELNKKINDQIARLVVEFQKAKVATEEKRKEIIREAYPFAKHLKEIEPEIAPEVLAKYKEIRAKKMPVYVPYSDGSCLGCGMGIKLEVDKLLVNPFDSAECPHCGRIVYKLS